MKKRKYLVVAILLALASAAGCAEKAEEKPVATDQTVEATQPTEDNQQLEEETPIAKTEESQQADQETNVENTEQPAKETLQVSEQVEPEQTEKTSAEEENKYAMYTQYSTKEVEDFAKEIKKEILNADWKAFSEKVSYPITVRKETYEDAETLANALKANPFEDDFIKAIKKESCEDLFCNAEGMMMGDGQIWFAEILGDNNKSLGLQIVAINW